MELAIEGIEEKLELGGFELPDAELELQIRTRRSHGVRCFDHDRQQLDRLQITIFPIFSPFPKLRPSLKEGYFSNTPL